MSSQIDCTSWLAKGKGLMLPIFPPFFMRKTVRLRTAIRHRLRIHSEGLRLQFTFQL